MKELVIISGKGGTGKTSITASFATLAQHSVLADCDVDAPDLHLVLNPHIEHKHPFSGGKQAKIRMSACSRCGICRNVCQFAAITENFLVDPIACEGCGVCVWNCPNDAIEFKPATNGEWYQSTSDYGNMIHARLGIGEENSGKLVTRVRQEAQNLARADNIELILVDGPPGTGCPTIAAIGGADHLLIVTEPTVSAIHDMKRIIELANHFNTPVSVLINKADINTERVEEIRTFCETRNIRIVGHIPYHKIVTQAQVNAQPVVQFAPDHPVSREIIKSWNRCLECLNGSQNE